jgi:hypothetical protein
MYEMGIPYSEIVLCCQEIGVGFVTLSEALERTHSINSLNSERLHRIDAHGSSGRQPSRKESDGKKE